MAKVILANNKEWLGTIKLPFAKDREYRDNNKLLIGHYSKLRLYKIEITDTVEATYTLKINFSSKSNLTHPEIISTSGMFVSTYDRDVLHTKEVKSSTNLHKRYQNIKFNDEDGLPSAFEETGHTISLPNWKWGREAEVEFECEGENNNFQVCLALRPFILLDFQTELKLTLIQKSRKNGTKKVELSMMCEFDEDFGEDDSGDNLYFMLKEFGTLKIDGRGASIHPKQLVTVKLLQYIFEKKIKLNPEKRKKLKIAYFGPDSTENLRSVMRLINGEENLHVNLYLVVHPEWDIYSAVVPFNNTEYQLTNGNNITFYKIDLLMKYYSQYGAQKEDLNFNDDEFGIEEAKDISEMDVIISTYVAPWTLFNKDERAKEVYEKCLDDMMGFNTYLLTIDPGSASDLVISNANVDFDTVEAINDFYLEKLGFKNTQFPYHKDSFVKGNIWTLEDGVKR